MEKANIYLFTSLTCPHCPSAKKFMEEFKETRDDIIYKELITSTLEGKELANKFQIQSVPTFIIQGLGLNELIGLTGTPSKESMNKYIDIALGKKELPQETSFIDKIKNFFN